VVGSTLLDDLLVDGEIAEVRFQFGIRRYESPDSRNGFLRVRIKCRPFDGRISVSHE
jgi:hypothetical protein